MVSSTLIQNSICTERQRIVRAKQGGKGSGRGGRWGGAGLTEQQLWRRRRTEHPAWRPASILRLEPVSSTTPAFCSALRADGKTQREALAQALGAGGLPAPVALPVGRIRVASPALPPPSSILGGQSTMGRESSRVTGWAKKRSTPEPIHNRTDSIVPSPDRTASGITGDVALSVSALVKAGFLYREIYSLRHPKFHYAKRRFPITSKCWQIYGVLNVDEIIN
jgi:hypothetical protein